MPARASNSGTCALCQQVTTKAKMPAHLDTCVPKHEAAGAARPLLRLRIADAYDARYWIYVEMRADAPLRQLDTFLRQLWLECCGHMSAFSADRHELSMGSAANIALQSVGGKFHYEYDFGSTTALTGHLLNGRSGPTGRFPVRLLARNDPLAFACAQCSAPATVVCPYCPENGLFCEAHAGVHEHAVEEAYLPVVNSPRMGVCGYTG